MRAPSPWRSSVNDSSPARRAFAESWCRTRQGFREAAASEADLAAAERTLRRETGDDREIEQREATAAAVTGAWLRNFADAVSAEIQGIESALSGLGFDLDGAPDRRADAPLPMPASTR